MAFCAPPQLIADDPPIFTTEDPGFEALVGSDMPDPDTLLDGLDAILGIPIGAIDDDVAALSTLDVLLAAASFTPGAWTAANVTPLIALYASLGAAGDVLLTALLSAIANLPVIPTVPAIPPDPGLTVEDLCGACEEGNITTISINTIDLGPGQAPGSPSAGGDCLNPQAGGGYAPGPCPSQNNPNPPDNPPPDEPPPDTPPPDEPPPDQPPDQGGGDLGGIGGGFGAGGDGDVGGFGEFIDA